MDAGQARGGCGARTERRLVAYGNPGSILRTSGRDRPYTSRGPYMHSMLVGHHRYRAIATAAVAPLWYPPPQAGAHRSDTCRWARSAGPGVSAPAAGPEPRQSSPLRRGTTGIRHETFEHARPRSTSTREASNSRPAANTRAHTHARMHARAHAHTHTHIHIRTRNGEEVLPGAPGRVVLIGRQAVEQRAQPQPPQPTTTVRKSGGRRGAGGLTQSHTYEKCVFGAPGSTTLHSVRLRTKAVYHPRCNMRRELAGSLSTATATATVRPAGNAKPSLSDKTECSQNYTDAWLPVQCAPTLPPRHGQPGKGGGDVGPRKARRQAPVPPACQLQLRQARAHGTE